MLTIAVLGLVAGSPQLAAIESPHHALPKGAELLQPDDPGQALGFGRDIALHGSVAAVTAPISGAVYVFQNDGSEWRQTARLVAPDGGQGFGAAVALSGPRLVVGAPFDDDLGIDAGAAYVFVRSGSAWVFQDKLHGSATGDGDRFGHQVALSGTHLLVCALYDDLPFLGEQVGRVYSFEGGYRSWSEEGILDIPGGGYGFDAFGSSIEVDDDLLCIGAPYFSGGGQSGGSAYVYTRSNGQWILRQVLDSTQSFGLFDLGLSVAVEGDTVACGAPYEDGPGENFGGAGAVYAYTRSGNTISTEQKLCPDDAAFESTGFGVRVALGGGRMLVARYSGTVDVFERTRFGWARVDRWRDESGAKLYGPAVAQGDGFALVRTSTGGVDAVEVRPNAPRPALISSPDHLLFYEGGARQVLHYDGGTQQAGLPFVVLGTTSGTTPGQVLDGVPVQLVADAYTQLTLGSPASTPLVGSVGVLDARGRATASFVVPPGGFDFSVAETMFHHAFVLLDPTGQTVVAASEPARVWMVY